MSSWDGIFLEAPGIASAAAVATGVVSAVLALRATALARKLTRDNALEEAIETADLEKIGAMLRDRLGKVSLEALLDDSVTQDRVFRSLQRLTELVNQPIPGETSRTEPAPTEEEPNVNGNSPVPLSENVQRTEQVSLEASVDTNVRNKPALIDSLPPEQLSIISRQVREVADTYYAKVQKLPDVWTSLAGARRDLEKVLLSRVHWKILRPQIFADPQLRNAMGVFLRTANRAIHGVDVSSEEALKSLVALAFLSTRLAAMSATSGA